ALPLGALDDGKLEGTLAVQVEGAQVDRERRLDPFENRAREELGELLRPGFELLRVEGRKEAWQGSGHFVGGELFGSVEVETGVEDFEGHELGFAGLVLGELGAGDGAEGHSDAFEAETLEQAFEQGDDDGLREVGDDAEGTFEIAADGGVAEGLLAHVAGL